MEQRKAYSSRVTFSSRNKQPLNSMWLCKSLNLGKNVQICSRSSSVLQNQLHEKERKRGSEYNDGAAAVTGL